MKNPIWKAYFHIRNLWINYRLQPLRFKEDRKHYVRVIVKDCPPQESIYEIRGAQLNIPIKNGEEMIFDVVETGKDEKGDYIKLQRMEGNKEEIQIPINLPHDLIDENIRLIYTNIKVYGKN